MFLIFIHLYNTPRTSFWFVWFKWNDTFVISFFDTLSLFYQPPPTHCHHCYLTKKQIEPSSGLKRPLIILVQNVTFSIYNLNNKRFILDSCISIQYCHTKQCYSTLSSEFCVWSIVCSVVAETLWSIVLWSLYTSPGCWICKKKLKAWTRSFITSRLF